MHRIEPWLQPQLDFIYFQMFREKLQKHEAWRPKVVKTHEQSIQGQKIKPKIRKCSGIYFCWFGSLRWLVFDDDICLRLKILDFRNKSQEAKNNRNLTRPWPKGLANLSHHLASRFFSCLKMFQGPERWDTPRKRSAYEQRLYNCTHLDYRIDRILSS